MLHFAGRFSGISESHLGYSSTGSWRACAGNGSVVDPSGHLEYRRESCGSPMTSACGRHVNPIFQFSRASAPRGVPWSCEPCERHFRQASEGMAVRRSPHLLQLQCDCDYFARPIAASLPTEVSLVRTCFHAAEGSLQAAWWAN